MVCCRFCCCWITIIVSYIRFPPAGPSIAIKLQGLHAVLQPAKIIPAFAEVAEAGSLGEDTIFLTVSQGAVIGSHCVQENRCRFSASCQLIRHNTFVDVLVINSTFPAVAWKGKTHETLTVILAASIRSTTIWYVVTIFCGSTLVFITLFPGPEGAGS